MFDQLLDATIQHLEALRARGVQHVKVDSAVLAALRASTRIAKTAPVSHGAAALALRPGPAPTPATKPAAITPLHSPSATLAAGATPSPPAAPLPSPASVPPSVADLRTPILGPPISREVRAAGMSELREQAIVCQKCPHLVAARKQVVFGVGDIHSPLLFVGEAPGADEDEQGEPFVGAAGQLLTRIIQTMGLSRETVYIANVLKCRPDTPGQRSGNRKPTTEEMNTCSPYLLRQIELIQPKVMVALGATAIEGLFGRPEKITQTRGKWREFRGIPLMPTYHPAYLLRNQAMSVKRQVWEDMLEVMQRLALPISEKQRAYFLRP